MGKMNRVDGYENDVEGAGNGWELVEAFSRFDGSGRYVSSGVTTRKHVLQGYLVRTFYQFFDGQQMHVSMSQTYVPDPNEQWTIAS